MNYGGFEDWSFNNSFGPLAEVYEYESDNVETQEDLTNQEVEPPPETMQERPLRSLNLGMFMGHLNCKQRSVNMAARVTLLR